MGCLYLHQSPANMKVLVFCALVASACAWPNWVQSDAATPDAAHRQQAVNHLLYKVTEKLHYKDLADMAANFDPVGDVSMYNDDGASAQKLVIVVSLDRNIPTISQWASLWTGRSLMRESSTTLT